MFAGDLSEAIGLRSHTSSYCKILRLFWLRELSHNLKLPKGEFVERNKGECVETGPAFSWTFQRWAGCLFPFAVMVTHLKGEELVVERNHHIAFVDDLVCESLRQTYIDQT